MTTSQEMDDQFGDSEIERRLKELERKVEAYEQGGFDIFRQFGYLQLGLKMPRIASNGIQIASDSVQIAGIYFLHKLLEDPADAETFLKLDTLISATAVSGGLVASGSGGDSHAEVILTTGANSEVILVADEPAGSGSAFVDLFWQAGQAMAVFKMDDSVLRLASLTADPAGLVQSDGNIWYRSDTDFFYGRRNGSSLKFLMDGDVTSTTTVSLSFIIDGGGSTITTGQKGHLEVPFAMTITGWTILADQSGSIVVDVWKDTYANFPPTVADTIAGSEKPTLSSAQKNQDLALSTWTTSVTAGDILAFNVDSATTVQRVLVSIRGTRT